MSYNSGCGRRIRTVSLGYEPSKLPLLHPRKILVLRVGNDPTSEPYQGSANPFQLTEHYVLWLSVPACHMRNKLYYCLAQGLVDYLDTSYW